MSKKLITHIICAFSTILFLFHATPLSADIEVVDLPSTDEYFQAKVLSVKPHHPESTINHTNNIVQPYTIQAISGSLFGKIFDVTQEAIKNIHPVKDIKVGDVIIIQKSDLNTPPFFIQDVYRLSRVVIVILLFCLLVILLTGKKGVRAVASLVLTFFIIISFIIPQIISGKSAFFVMLIGGSLILGSTLFVSHGWNLRTRIAFFSSLIAIALASVLGWATIFFTKLYGLGTEEAFFIQVGNLADINLKGLLLGSIIIGAIGVLDDVTMVQVTTIEEMYNIDPNITQKNLHSKALKIGHEHIISMMNTLFIAYAGAMLPMFLFFGFQSNMSVPLWVKLNSELIIEEVVRSIVGSTALVCSVPITTYISVHYYKKKICQKNP